MSKTEELRKQFDELWDLREDLIEEARRVKYMTNDRVKVMYYEMRVGAVQQQMAKLVGTIMEIEEDNGELYEHKRH